MQTNGPDYRKRDIRRLAEIAKTMSELPPQPLSEIETAVHIRDLKAIIKRLLENIET